MNLKVTFMINYIDLDFIIISEVILINIRIITLTIVALCLYKYAHHNFFFSLPLWSSFPKYPSSTFFSHVNLPSPLPDSLILFFLYALTVFCSLHLSLSLFQTCFNFTYRIEIFLLSCQKTKQKNTKEIINNNNKAPSSEEKYTKPVFPKQQ